MDYSNAGYGNVAGAFGYNYGWSTTPGTAPQMQQAGVVPVKSENNFVDPKIYAQVCSCVHLHIRFMNLE